MTSSSPILFFLSVLLTLLSTIPTCLANDSWQLFSRIGKTVTRTTSFSEEGSGFSGRQTAPIAGIICSGGYCDNKQLVVVRDGTSAPVLETGHWTGWFSEEHPNYSGSCPPDMIVNEVQCHGGYCDNLRLQCGRLTSNYRVVASHTAIANWFSEEEGERLCPNGYYVRGVECRGEYCDGIKLNCVLVQYKPTMAKNVVADSLKFAPIYYFDGSASEYCLPDWPSAANNNHCRTSFLSKTPSFVEYNICGGLEVYTFWLWYGKQKKCIVLFDEGHDDDWEHVSVFVRDGLVQKVTFYQHKGHYTRRRGTFGMSGERPHVYVGKVAHGSYHTSCDGVCSFTEFFTKGCLGSVNYCQGGCGYWDDFRNPGPRLSHYYIHDLHRGQTIDGIERPERNICQSSCEGSGARILGTAGCWQNNV